MRIKKVHLARREWWFGLESQCLPIVVAVVQVPNDIEKWYLCFAEIRRLLIQRGLEDILNVEMVGMAGMVDLVVCSSYHAVGPREKIE